jgi:glycosyltransferase involved in cell wall biosynthesis
MALHVGLNALHLVPGETGGGELYARRLLPALLEARDDLRLTLFVGREAGGERWPERVEVVRLPVRTRSRPRRVLAEQALLPAAVVRSRPDLLHNLFTTAPALPSVPQVTTILDVIYKRFPETHAGLLSRGMAVLVPLAARRSRRVLTLSHAAKRDIVDFLGVPADRIDVTPLASAIPAGVTPVAEEELRRRLGIGSAPIVLTVSAKRPHKNLSRLLDAFAQLESRDPPVLVAPGYRTPFEDDLRVRADALGISHRVRFLGWIDDATLEGLYRAATCFVFPSLAEGFGLPVLEALARGTPVACSRTSSLPEVAGDAALLFDPEDTGAIRTALERLLADAALRRRLALAGRERATEFDWQRTAELTAQSYERALAR